MSRPLPSSSSRTFRITALAIAISLGTSSCATVDNFVANNSGTVNCIAGGLLGAATGAAAGALTYVAMAFATRAITLAEVRGLVRRSR